RSRTGRGTNKPGERREHLGARAKLRRWVCPRPVRTSSRTSACASHPSLEKGTGRGAKGMPSDRDSFCSAVAYKTWLTTEAVQARGEHTNLHRIRNRLLSAERVATRTSPWHTAPLFRRAIDTPSTSMRARHYPPIL